MRNKDITSLILIELDKMEHWSTEYSDLLLHFSKFLRNKIWPAYNEKLFQVVLSIVNMFCLSLPCCVESINMYVELLGKQFSKYSPKVKVLFELEQDSIQKIAAMDLIKKQWKNINAPVGEASPFISVFDTFYNQGVLKYPDLYIVNTVDACYLYRACRDLKADYDRFIPWPNKAKNRWNPPGKTYLYLSYGISDEMECHGKYTVNQHTCMEEMRGSIGEEFAICRFKAKPGLRILDLSYNDVTERELKEPMDTAMSIVESRMMKGWLPKAINDPNTIRLFQEKPDEFEVATKELIQQECLNADLEKNSYSYIGKQYLKLICDAVFLPIDDDGDKEAQYHSFWDMANYLESKGFDGIIFPSTRAALKGLKTKNLVLFDIHAAEPDISTKQICTLV